MTVLEVGNLEVCGVKQQALMNMVNDKLVSGRNDWALVDDGFQRRLECEK